MVAFRIDLLALGVGCLIIGAIYFSAVTARGAKVRLTRRAIIVRRTLILAVASVGGFSLIGMAFRQNRILLMIFALAMIASPAVIILVGLIQIRVGGRAAASGPTRAADDS